MRPQRSSCRPFHGSLARDKTVANRVFTAAREHVVIWDGSDDAGNHVRSGVYFYQIKTPTWTSQKKLAVLSN